MKLKMFAVFDVKAAAYLAPFFLPTVGQAVRAFADASNDPSTMFAKHPEDYTLFHVGEFDDSSGDCAPVVPHASLGNAAQFVMKAAETADRMVQQMKQ